MKCDLCENPAMHIHAKCHVTAPIRAEIEGDEIRLYCYIPDCNRHIVTLKLAKNYETTITVSKPTLKADSKR